ncbi:T9SS type A sorting domain-containing protein [bacterium]|nr:T9SS type A sorting domain-containing protein [bacterium]
MLCRFKTYVPAVFVMLALITFTPFAEAGQVSTTLNFDSPTISRVDGFDNITLPNAFNLGDPGTPSLPQVGVWLMLAPGEEAVLVNLKSQKWESISGNYLPAPNIQQRPLSALGPFPQQEPDTEIYNSKNVYPLSPTADLMTHLKRGFAVSTVLVCPVRWNPTDSSLEYLVSAEVVIETSLGVTAGEGFNNFYRGDLKTRTLLEAKVSNPEMSERYPRRDDDEMESILLITVDDLMDAAEEYAAWRNTRGQVTHIVTVDQLIESEEGIDDQDCIRNGIKSAYRDLDIGYVLLMGDTEQVPHRGLYGNTGDMEDLDIPADLYYAGLDGNWNNNNNARWGENVDGADMLAEVYVGRMPGASNNEIRRITHKVMLYSDTPVVDDILKALMLGEELGWNVMGGDYMDELYAGSNRVGHRTVGFPDRYERYNLYDREREWSGTQDLRPLFSEGYHLVHHLGHAFTDAVFKLNYNQVTDNRITNDGEENGFNIAYSQGCYAGAFDNRGTEPNSYFDFDCVGEKFVSGISNGFVAFLCNGRYGWGNGNSVDGASQQFEREFIDAIFAENITKIGETNQDSKEDIVDMCGSGGMRWCYFQVNLLGDPIMDIWTDEPEEFEINCQDVIMLGSEEFSVTVEGVEGATVCISKDGDIYGLGVTDENGYVLLDFDEPVSDVEPLTLVVTAHNYMPYYGEIETMQSEHGYPWIDELTIDDSEGNDNQEVNAGERIFINPLIRNLGQESLTNMTVTISSFNQMVRIHDAAASYEVIEPGASTLAGDMIELTIVSNCPDMRRVEVELLITDNDNDETWNQTLSFIVHSANLVNSNLIVLDDEGGNAGVLTPGEEMSIVLMSTNTGSSDAENLAAELVCDNPMVEIVEGEVNLDHLPVNESNTFEQYFTVRISDDCPDPYLAIFYVRISGEFGYLRTCMQQIGIGGANYTFENDDEVWQHYNIGNDWGDQWDRSDRDNYTPGGINCIKVGPANNNGANYQHNLNCAIEMPEFTVTAPMQLFFWHKISAEESAQNAGRAYDGGFVEISVNSSRFETLTPDNGYTHTIRHGESDNPLDDDQLCWSGEFDWQPVLFDLSDYLYQDLSIRFHFGSDGGEARRGWWIDDVQLRLKVEPESPVDVSGEVRYGGAWLTWTTPPVRDDYPEELIGYKIFRCSSTESDFLDTLITDNQYLDYLVGQPADEYYYIVYSIYATQEVMSEGVAIEWTQDVETEDNTLPDEWELSGIYPNPFNSTTRIAYNVPTQGSVHIAIYDLSGRRLTVLANGMHNPGRHQAVLNADNWTSGIYIVKLTTPAGSIASRMVLIR